MVKRVSFRMRNMYLMRRNERKKKKKEEMNEWMLWCGEQRCRNISFQESTMTFIDDILIEREQLLHRLSNHVDTRTPHFVCLSVCSRLFQYQLKYN